MRISTGRRGFTLIELLVVILLLGLGLGLGLTLDYAGSPQQQKQQTLALANALELVAQDAVLDNQVLGLDFFTVDRNPGWRWLQWHDGTWQAYERDGMASASALPAGMSAALSVAGQDFTPEARVDLPAAAAFSPEILLLPTRELTPFMLTIAGPSGAVSTLTSDLMGRIRVDEDDAPTPP